MKGASACVLLCFTEAKLRGTSSFKDQRMKYCKFFVRGSPSFQWTQYEGWEPGLRYLDVWPWFSRPAPQLQQRECLANGDSILKVFVLSVSFQTFSQACENRREAKVSPIWPETEGGQLQGSLFSWLASTCVVQLFLLLKRSKEVDGDPSQCWIWGYEGEGTMIHFRVCRNINETEVEEEHEERSLTPFQVKRITWVKKLAPSDELQSLMLQFCSVACSNQIFPSLLIVHSTWNLLHCAAWTLWIATDDPVQTQCQGFETLAVGPLICVSSRTEWLVTPVSEGTSVQQKSLVPVRRRLCSLCYSSLTNFLRSWMTKKFRSN